MKKIFFLSHLSYIFLIALIFLPVLSVCADETDLGGFITAPLWLSTESPVAGTTVSLYTAVYNPFSTPIRATVVFTEQQTILGEETKKIPANTSMVFRVPWTPQKGVRIITAEITDVRTAASGKGKSETVSAKKMNLVKSKLSPVRFVVRDAAVATNTQRAIEVVLGDRVASFIPGWVSGIGQSIWDFAGSLFEKK